jgi:membrane protease subunit (stomatin/prohibitin family)
VFGADAAGAGLGFGFGMMMPYMIARAYQWPGAWPQGHAHTTGYGHLSPLVAAEPRFCGHCGGGLVPQARFCGYCGRSVQR